jgi:hypothetical protein
VKTELERRYERDSEFRTACDVMYAMAVKLQYTPQELRDVAYMAAMRYEMDHGFKRFTVSVTPEEYERLHCEMPWLFEKSEKGA